MNITRNQNSEELSKYALIALSRALQSAGSDGVLLLISGGSVLSLVENLRVPETVPNLTVAMIDERFDTDPKVNNFLMLTQTAFYRDAVCAGVLFLESVPKEGESLSDFSERIASQWGKRFASFPNEKVVALLGVGPDGHTAGVFPFPENREWFEVFFVHTSNIFVGYDAQQKNIHPKRATATLAFLKDRVDETLVFMSGQSKRGALQDILSDDGELSETPARIIREMKNVSVFTDIF